MRKTHNFHAFVLAVSERVTLLKMRLLEKENIREHLFYKTPAFSSFIYGLF